MNIQIYGRKKCFDTKKAERYFKERRIKFQMIDLDKYGLSKREQESVLAAVGLKELSGGAYAPELLLNNPKLYRSPIVRNGRSATVGYKPEVWDTWE